MKKLLTFLMMSILAIGVGWAEEVTYTFTSKSWAATPENWTGTADGNQFNSSGTPKGVQVTTSAGSGATVTCPQSYSNISKVTVTYSSSSKGVGSIEVKVGTTSLGSKSISKSQTEVNLEYTADNLTGVVSFIPTVTTNSMGINAVTITYSSSGTQTVATPTFSPAAGTYYEPQSVTLSCATSGATVYYTTDGNDPTTSSSVYSTAIAVNSTTTIKAMATADGYDPSSVAEATYTISSPPEVQLNYENTLISGHTDFYIVHRAMGGLNQVWKDSKYGITANGYGCSENVESWLYSPVFDATSKDGYNIKLDFEENLRYFASNDLAASQATLWVREGTTGEWRQLIITPHDNVNGDDFHSINTIDLSAYAGKKFQLAFKYLATTSNPGRWEIKNFSVTATPQPSTDLYILGMINGNGEYPTRAVKMSYDGSNYTAKIWVIGNKDNAMGIPGSWMAFTTVLAENNDNGGWGYVNDNRYSPSPDNGDYYWLTNGSESDIPLTKQNNDKAFLIPAGLYEITVSGDLSKFSLNTIKDLTPTINPDGGEVNQYSTATVSISEDFNAFIADCNDVVYANGNVVDDITPPVAKFYLNDGLIDGTSTSYQFSTIGSVTLTGKCTLVSSDTEYATKTATANFTVNEVTLGDDVYILVTNTGELNTTDSFIIVSKDHGYAMSTEQRNANRGATAITLNNNGATANISNDTQVFTLEEGNGGWYFNTGDGYIYASSNSSNELKTEASIDANGNALAAITINASTGEASVIFQGNNGRNDLRFNNSNNPKIFSCYASTSTMFKVYIYKKGSTTPPSNQVATPSINPGSSDSSNPYTVYGGKQEITITCATDGATIYYTTDGTNPTTSSNQYTDAFDLTSTGGPKTVKAIAVKTDLDDSAIATSYYLFTSPAAPTFNPVSGTVRTEAFDVTISSDYTDAEIYYMLDPASAPNANDFSSTNLYNGAVNVSGEGPHTIYAMVVRNGIKSTVVKATYTITSGTIGDGDYVKVTSSDDLTDGEYLIVYEDGLVAFDGSLETLDAVGNSISVTINNDKIPGNATVDAAVFTYDANAKTLKSASGYYIGREANSNGLDYDDETIYTNIITFDEDANAIITAEGGCTLRYNKNSDQVRFRYYKSGQQAIQLYKKIPPKPVVLEGVAFTAERQWATWFGEEALALPENVTAYVVTGINDAGTAVEVESVNYIPANTGVLLYSTTATESVSAMPAEAGESVTSLLQGGPATVNNAYVLYNNQFILAQDGTTVGAHRCYLPMTSEAQGAPRLLIGDPGTVTGIEDLLYDSNGKPVGYYDLTGRYVGTSLNGKRGIFITSDGKKVVR